ncbi:RNA polymerase sigma-70 factor, ECF subfamily [Lishizhenia tianjinensis]|uniref:RNA polymerase sigma-70 factor, ECF subfamily n=1 Tax=Lishizhenia tianjinensis TaxID=477690 RepID=A0A1I7ANU9_9FLAO|nr:sigma-70 family RNA polymerase sigma factor [Lishizhenia tianjinensis]SFT76617.1 RNA polymerase sigma-70 factor, ECF subfamily [Lishizhenia tianjinensis]
MIKKRKLNQFTEAQLIETAKQSEKAFGELYRRNFDKVFRFAFKRLGGNDALASDITQQTFIKAFAAIGKYEDKGYAFSTWLIRIAQNEINQFFRKNNKIYTVEVEEKHVMNFMDFMEIDERENQDKQEKLIQILNNLKQEYLDLIELRFFQQKSFREIAAIYAISEANAKMRLYRIIEKIKKEVY